MTLKPNSTLNLIKNDNPVLFEKVINNDDYSNADRSQFLIELNSILQNKYGSSLIHLCVQYNAHKICRLIFSKYFTVAKNFIDKRDFEFKTPLHTACTFGSFECVQILIKNGAEINKLKRGDWSALMITVTKLDISLTSLLLENGADLTVRNKNGWNVLHLAARTGLIDLIKILDRYLQNLHLVQLWYDKVNNGRTLMHIAAIHQHFEVFNFLINHLEFDLNVKDCCGITPFMDAARANCVQICQLIYDEHSNKKKKFNVNDCDYLKRSALHQAAQANACETIQFLSSLHCDLDLQDIWGQSAIFLAVQEGHFEATKLLIDLGANKHLQDFNKRELTDVCLQYQHENLYSLLNFKD